MKRVRSVLFLSVCAALRPNSGRRKTSVAANTKTEAAPLLAPTTASLDETAVDAQRELTAPLSRPRRPMSRRPRAADKAVLPAGREEQCPETRLGEEQTLRLHARGAGTDGAAELQGRDRLPGAGFEVLGRPAHPRLGQRRVLGRGARVLSRRARRGVVYAIDATFTITHTGSRRASTPSRTAASTRATPPGTSSTRRAPSSARRP